MRAERGRGSERRPGWGDERATKGPSLARTTSSRGNATREWGGARAGVASPRRPPPRPPPRAPPDARSARGREGWPPGRCVRAAGRGGRRGGAPSSTPTRNRAAQTLILAPRAHGASRGRVGSAFAARARRGRTWNWSILFIGGTDCLGYRGARDFLSVLGLHDEVAAGEGRGRDVRSARSRARRAQRDDGVAGGARERRGARSARTCGRWGRSAS